MANTLKFISNNVNGIQSHKKRLNLIEYFKSNLNSEGFLFMQETHSTLKDEVNWIQEFKGHSFSHTVNPILVSFLTTILALKLLKIRNKVADKGFLETELDDQSFTLINLYNPNTESEQLEVLEKLENMLSTSSLTGDFKLFFNSKRKVYFDRYLENSKPLCKKIYFQAKSFFGIYSASLRLHFHI